MSRRNNKDDPLLKAFLDTYKLNLLAVPRRDAQVGDVYVETKDGVSFPGRLQSLLTPALAMPEIHTGEKLADIATKQTRALQLKVGLGLLEGFFNAIGATSALGKIKAAYEQNGAALVRFKLKSATRDWVDMMAFGTALMPCRLNRKHPFVQPGNRYYATVGVLRSPSITIAAEDSKSNDVSVEASAVKGAVGVEGKLAVKREGSGELTYEGSEPLAFGVELVELIYDEGEKRFQLSALAKPVPVRVQSKIERVFIGDAKKGDVFLRIREES
jgi:hypothetical protein